MTATQHHPWTPPDALIDALRRLDDAEREAVAAREALRITGELIARQAAAGTPDERMAALRYLYWHVPQVAVKILEREFELSRPGYVVVGEGPTLGTCQQCGAAIKAESRTHAAAARGRHDPCDGRIHLCKPCREARDEARARESAASVRRWRQREDELNAMTRDEFRQTPEWQRRARELLSPWQESGPGDDGHTVHPECLICGSRITLGTYVRPDVRRPRYDDVRVFCSRCGPEYEERGMYVDMTP
jgi:hypothetical protein